MGLSHVPFVLAALAVASTATAHSWELASVVGTIDPGAVSCDDRGCTATLRAERIQMQYDDFDRREDAVKLTVPARPALGGRGETWPDARSALLALGGAPVRARGEFVAWLDLEDVRVDEMGIALAAPSDHEAATVRAVKKLVHPTAARSSLRALRAGDRLTQEGAYVLPAPGDVKRGLRGRNARRSGAGRSSWWSRSR